MGSQEVVFRCKKCHHLLFVKEVSIDKLQQVMITACPNCNEDGYDNWILLRMGNYEEEYAQNDGN